MSRPTLYVPLNAPSTGIHTRASSAHDEASSPGRQDPPAFPTSSGVTLRGRARPTGTHPLDCAAGITQLPSPTHHRATETRGHHACSRAGDGRPIVAVKRVGSVIRRQGPVSSGGDSPNKRTRVGLACPQPSWVWITKATGPSLAVCSVDTLTLSRPPTVIRRVLTEGYLRPAMLTSITFLRALAMLSAAGSSCLLVLRPPSDAWTGPAALRTTGICEVPVSHLLGRQVGPDRGYLPPPPQTAAIDCKLRRQLRPTRRPRSLLLPYLLPASRPRQLRLVQPTSSLDLSF